MVGLHQAASEGAVRYGFAGNGTTVGGTLVLRNLTDRPLSIVIPTATLLESADGRTQPMVTGKNETVVLGPGETWTGPISAFCTDHFKPPPPSEGGAPVSLGPRTALTDELAGLINSQAVVQEDFAKDPKHPVGTWEERDPKGFWDTALLWAIYAATQKIGQATYQETMENQFSEQVSEPRAKQEARALGNEVFTAVHIIEDKWKEMKEDEVDLTLLDPTLKYRPEMEKSPKSVESGQNAPSPLAEVAFRPDEGVSGRGLAPYGIWHTASVRATERTSPSVLPAIYLEARGHRVSRVLFAAARQAGAKRISTDKDLDVADLDPTQKYRPPKVPPLTTTPGAPVVGDVTPLVATLPVGPIVEAYIFMAVDSHDRYQDLDAAHDWLDRALELSPKHPIATRLLDQVKAEEQQVGLQRAGVALGVLQQMMTKMAEEEEKEGEAMEQEEQQEGEEAPPADEPGPPPEEDF